jgi:hypothetical protein
MLRRWHEFRDQVARLWSDVGHLTARSRLLAAVASTSRSIRAIALKVCRIGQGAAGSSFSGTAPDGRQKRNTPL